jgi:hypothetical protein
MGFLVFPIQLCCLSGVKGSMVCRKAGRCNGVRLSFATKGKGMAAKHGSQKKHWTSAETSVKGVFVMGIRKFQIIPLTIIPLTSS